MGILAGRPAASFAAMGPFLAMGLLALFTPLYGTGDVWLGSAFGLVVLMFSVAVLARHYVVVTQVHVRRVWPRPRPVPWDQLARFEEIGETGWIEAVSTDGERTRLAFVPSFFWDSSISEENRRAKFIARLESHRPPPRRDVDDSVGG